MASLLGRIILPVIAVLTAFASQAAATSLEVRANTPTLPAPLSFSPDENWDGIDGKWSSFTLRIGTPQQFVRTFLSFAVYQTWAVLPQGCEAAANEQQCADARGWLYNQNASSTREPIGLYDLYVENKMGYDGNARYVYDVVGLGGEGEGGPTLANTTVGGFAVEDFYLGIFGINPKPTNFSSFNEPSPSYMTQLKEQRQIPSISFGYTAGAHYRYTGVLASLTLGGYDTGKYLPNNVTFTFAPDNERDVMVAIQSITTPSRIPSSPVATELLPTPIYALIDSTLPHIWLPLEACKAFEQEFGLIYDNTTNLYLVNDTLHDLLLERNANVTFTLAQGFADNTSVQISLPYAAFDLQAQPPYMGISNNTNYFPLRRAANESQYLLGRTFLQEAYIIVDYEVQRFQLAPVLWDQFAAPNLVAIPPANSSLNENEWTSPDWGQNGTASNGHSASGSLTGADIAGIVIGIVCFFALLALGWYGYRRHKQRKSRKAAAAAATAKRDSDNDSNAHVYPKAELAGSPLPFGITHHDLDRKGLAPPSPSTRLGTPHTPGDKSMNGYFPNAAGYSPISPSTGEGTHSSSQSGAVFSPISPASEADSRQLQIYEMPGDMPTIKEKDGKALSEKEALQHRERKYNGIDSSSPSPTTMTHPSLRGSRMVNAEDVVDARTGENITRHRAFSFEGERTKTEDDLYS